MSDLSTLSTLEDILVPTMFALFGALWGSFANVVILRLPAGKSVVSPRSQCPHCGTLIRWFDNIPILSWLILRAKCRKCKAAISWRYPLVELIMSILFLLAYVKLGWSWTLLEYLIFIFGLVTVSFIDFDHMILPDQFTLGGIVVGLLGAALNPEREFMPALWGVLLGGGFLWAVAYLYLVLRKQDGMGGGDIKLLAWIGAVLGVASIPFVILISSVVGSVVGILWSFKVKKGMQTTIPFGPYLALAALIYMLYGGYDLSRLYFSFFGLDMLVDG